MPNLNGGLFVAFIGIIIPFCTHAATSGACSQIAACPNMYVANTNIKVTSPDINISNYSAKCTKGNTYIVGGSYSGAPNGVCMVVPNCTQCESGYHIELVGFPVIADSNTGTLTCTSINVPYNVCAKDATSQQDCVSDTDWVGTLQGYEKFSTRTWNGTKCIESTRYRCAADWYGTPSTATTGCTHCPGTQITEYKPSTGKGESKIIAGHSNAGAQAITACWIDGYRGIDTTGIFEQPPCYYSK